MKTYIIDNYLHESFCQKLMEQKNTNSLDQVTLISLNNCINKNSAIDYELNDGLMSFTKALLPLKEKFPLYGEMFKYPGFIAQLVSFRQEMISYQISLDELPDSEERDQELKEILTIVSEIKLQSDITNAFINSNPNLKETTFYLPYLKHSQVALGDFLEHQEATKLTYKVEDVKWSFFKALNRQQELEACAQYIINHHLDVKDINMVLCDKDNNITLLESIFDRYQIPYSFTIYTCKTQIISSYIAIVKYLLSPSIETYRELVLAPFLQSENQLALVKYLDLFVTDLSVVNQPFNKMANPNLIKSKYIDQYDNYLKLEQKAEQLRCQLIFNQQDNAFVTAYNFLMNCDLLANSVELKAFNKLKDYLQANQEYLDDEQYYSYLIYQISAISVNIPQTLTNRLVITDLTHPILPRKYLFILEATQSNYPNLKSATGIFGEDYLQKIEKYPSQLVRNTHYMEQFEWLKTYGEEIIVSYFTNDFEGKVSQPAIDFEIIRGKKSEITNSWDLKESNHYFKLDTSLSADLAKQLFFQGSMLKGSISSFEKFFKCPYSYFLSSGLGIKENNDGITVATVGSIFHDLLDESFKKEGVNYNNFDFSESLDEKFKPLMSLYVNQKDLPIIKERMKKNLILKQEFLESFDGSDNYHITSSEEHFSEKLFTNEEYFIDFYGTIDRVDIYNDQINPQNSKFRIVDYKSSNKKLTLEKVRTGQSLQLLTYAYFKHIESQLACSGCYYLSLKPGSGEPQIDWLKSQKLNGWTFITDEVNKDFVANSNKIIDFNQVKEFVDYIYHCLIKELSNGNISCEHVKAGCEFCVGKNICQNRKVAVDSVIEKPFTGFDKEVNND